MSSYGRDAMAGPLREMCAMLAHISEGAFLPDETRSGRFASKTASAVHLAWPSTGGPGAGVPPHEVVPPAVVCAATPSVDGPVEPSTGGLGAVPSAAVVVEDGIAAISSSTASSAALVATRISHNPTGPIHLHGDRHVLRQVLPRLRLHLGPCPQPRRQKCLTSLTASRTSRSQA